MGVLLISVFFSLISFQVFVFVIGIGIFTLFLIVTSLAALD